MLPCLLRDTAPSENRQWFASGLQEATGCSDQRRRLLVVEVSKRPLQFCYACTPGYMIILPESDEDLLHECKVETFRSSGPGGQHVNKTESAVRLKHVPSGVIVMCQQDRSQHRNKAICLKKLRERVAKLNHRPAKRVRTRVPRSARNRTLEEKVRRSHIKRLRAKPSKDD